MFLPDYEKPEPDFDVLIPRPRLTIFVNMSDLKYNWYYWLYNFFSSCIEALVQSNHLWNFIKHCAMASFSKWAVKVNGPDIDLFYGLDILL